MKIALILLIASAPALASAPVVSGNIKTSATQAVLTFTPPSSSSSPCSIQVSESPNLTPLVHDVDPSLFAGSNLDNRPGNTAAGSQRSFVIGTRRSDKASDSFFYSRALQANTTHYYALACPGTGVTATTATALGDSITAGLINGTYQTNLDYVYLLSQIQGTTLTNRGVGGSSACSTTLNQMVPYENPSVDPNHVTTLMIGTNDANGFASPGPHDAIFNLCHQSLIAWETIASTAKTFASSCTQTGTWGADTAGVSALSGVGLTIGEASNTTGSTLSCPISTTGAPIYIWYHTYSSGFGTFSYRVDGGTAVSVPAVNQQQDGIALIRIPGVSAGLHTVLFNVTSSPGYVGIYALGTVSAGKTANPLYVGGVLRQQNDGLSANTTGYDADAKANVALLAGDGLPVYFVNVRPYVNPTTDMYDQLHPNIVGQQHLRDAFLAYETGVATGQFTTANPPLGNTYPEPLPFNANTWDGAAWPDINFADKTVGYVDPLTGILIKRISGPGEWDSHVAGYGYTGVYNPFTNDGSPNGLFTYFNDPNSAWTNASNVLSASQSTTATYSGTNSDPLFVSWGPSGLQYQFAFWNADFNGTANNDNPYTLDNIQLALFGTGTDANAANRTVEFCLSFYDSGSTCNTPYFTAVLPTTTPTPATTASAVYPASTVFPEAGGWAGWNTAIHRNDVSVYTGNYTTTGGTTVAFNTGVDNTHGHFNLNWKAGAKIKLTGSASITTPSCVSDICTIASVTDSTHLVITQSFNSATSNTFYSLASGVVIKKTTGTGTINLSLSSAEAWSRNFPNPNGGSGQLCSYKPVTVSYAADGVTPITPVQGYFCQFPSSTGLYLFIPSTGETRFIDPLYIDNAATALTSTDWTKAGYGATYFPGAFDASDPNKLYVWIVYGGTMTFNYGCPSGTCTYTSRANSIVTVSYNTANSACRYQSYSHPRYVIPNYIPGNDTTYNFNSGNIPGWSDSCLTYNNNNFAISNQGYLDHRIVTGSSIWKPSFTGPQGVGVPAVRAGKVFVGSSPTGQDTGLAMFVVDASTGNIDFSTHSLGVHGTGPDIPKTNGYPLRWSVIHTTDIGTPSTTVSAGPNDPLGNQNNGMGSFTGYGRGPFRFTATAIWKDGVWNTSDTSWNYTCPGGGANCVPDSHVAIACPASITSTVGATLTQLQQQGAVGNQCIQFKATMACSATPYWPYSATTTMTTSIAAGVTTIPWSAFANNTANALGITAGTYLYVSNFNLQGFPGGPSEAAFNTRFPSYELVYVSAVNTAAQTYTVARGVNGMTGLELPAYSTSPYPSSLGGITDPNPNGPVGVVYILVGSQSPEAADFPCEWGPTDIAGKPVYSMPSTTDPGDIFGDWGEKNQPGQFGFLQVVSVTPLGGGSYQYVASANVTSVYPNRTLPGTALQNWPNGWSSLMVDIGLEFYDTTNPSGGWYLQFGSGHTSYGFSGSSTYNTVNPAGNGPTDGLICYGVTNNSPSNPFAANSSCYPVPANVPWAGYSPTYNWQSYPNQGQFASPDPQNKRWAMDFHHLNPGQGGGGGDTPNTWGGQNCGLGVAVPGTSNVIKWACSQAPYKIIQPHGFAGKWLLNDISSPTIGNTITDATTFSICTALNAGECRADSVVGNTYSSVPQWGGQYTPNVQAGYCITNNHEENLPCVGQLQFHGGAINQFAIDVPYAMNNHRKLTYAFGVPGSNWTYQSSISDPTGQWAFFTCPWCGGVRSDMYAAKLPPFPADNVSYANNFVNISVGLGPSTQYDQARVRFGYTENGAAASFYCTRRADACMTSTSSTQAAPYAFVSEGAAWASCASGCTINFPSLPGRVLYYVVDRKNSSSGQLSSSEVRTAVTP